jgi:uncharacterized protein (TIGR00730 family)
MNKLESIVVYCGSSAGSHPKYMSLAKEVGQTLAQAGIKAVYGGGNVGLMGEMATNALNNGGHVFGVITEQLARLEVAHPTLTQLEIVETMHLRKARMVSLSDGVLVLPGGYGTLDELFEILAWRQLQIFHGPIGLLNLDGFYDLLLAHLDRTVEGGFLQPANRDLLLVADNLPELLEKMRQG